MLMASVTLKLNLRQYDTPRNSVNDVREGFFKSPPDPNFLCVYIDYRYFWSWHIDITSSMFRCMCVQLLSWHAHHSFIGSLCSNPRLAFRQSPWVRVIVGYSARVRIPDSFFPDRALSSRFPTWSLRNKKGTHVAGFLHVWVPHSQSNVTYRGNLYYDRH